MGICLRSKYFNIYTGVFLADWMAFRCLLWWGRNLKALMLLLWWIITSSLFCNFLMLPYLCKSQDSHTSTEEQIPAVKHLLTQLSQLHIHAEMFPLASTVSDAGQKLWPCASIRFVLLRHQITCSPFGKGLKWSSDFSVLCLRKSWGSFFKLTS